MYKRIVLVGDSECGKTALAVKVSECIFNDFYEPTSFENFQAEVPTNKGLYNVTIMDTSGFHDDTELRALAYKDCDAVIICFDLTEQSTLSSIEDTWIDEVKKYCPQVPVFITGCKRDAMCDRVCTCGGNCCTQNEAELLEIVQRTGAVAYSECSAAEQSSDDGVEDLFKYVLESSNKKKKSILSSIRKRSKLLKRRLSVLKYN